MGKHNISSPEKKASESKKGIKAAVFDIDDTLFDMKEKRFIPSAIEGLKKLQEKGILVILATGRPPQTALSICEEGVCPDYTVCVNGHRILDREGKVIADHFFDPVLADEIYEYCRKENIGLLWKYEDGIYEYIHSQAFEKFYNKTKTSRKNLFFGLRDSALPGGPNGGCLACAKEALSAFNRHFEGRCRAVAIDGESSDLMLFGVNKASGVEEVLCRLKISPKDCIAFGDNLNDREILSYAGIGVCVGNGSEELKKLADYVTSDIWENGIARALKHFKLIE